MKRYGRLNWQDSIPAAGLTCGPEGDGQSLRTMAAAPTWVLAFLWARGVTSGKMASSCTAGCCFGGREPSDPHTDLGAWARVSQCGSGRSHRPATVAWSSVWPGRQQQPAESSVWPEWCCWWFLSWTRWIQVCLCFAEVTEKSAMWPWQSSQQDFVGQGSSLQNSVLCLAEWGSDGAVVTSLIWVITAWAMSSLESVNQCWTEVLSPFHWLVSSPKTERTARAHPSKISLLTTEHQMCSLPSPEK